MLPEAAVRGAMTTILPAMGGVVETHVAAGPADAADRVQRVFSKHEAVLSSFRPGSELCALNRCGGQPFAASPLLASVLSRALDVARATGGLFDPTIIDALEAAGYDRTFDDVARSGGALSLLPRPAGRWRNVTLDRRTGTVTLPAGVRVDLGGIGKGYTVDAAVRALGRDANALVNASGDLYAAGAGPDGAGWRIGVADPLQPERDLAVLELRDRAVATSGPTRRAWERGGRRLHHIIDPRSGQPADMGAASITLIAPDATTADALATVACLLPPAEALGLAASFDVDAFAVSTTGAISMTPGTRRYLAA